VDRDAAKIRASCERKQKTDRRDAELLRRLLAEDRFPRIWVPTAAERDARQLLLHRHKLVRMRTQVKNQLQAQALNQGVQRKRKLWSEAGRKQLESLPLLPWANRRRAELLQLLDQLDGSIGD
jgi:transposase